MDSPFKLAVSGIVGLIVLILLYTFWPLVSVSAGHKGIVTMFGEVKPGSLEPGLNFVNPMARIIDINTQVQKVEVKGVAASKDLQQIHTTITANYHLSPIGVDRLYSTVGLDFQEKIIQPAAQEAFKAVTAKHTATELIEKRGDVKIQLQTALSAAVEAVSAKTIIIDEVFITDFGFTDSFTKAVEDKQTAEQRVLTEQRKLQSIEIQAKQRIAQAEGEARAIQIQAQSISAQGGQAYVQLKTVEKWDGKLPVYNTGAIPFINLPTPTK